MLGITFYRYVLCSQYYSRHFSVLLKCWPTFVVNCETKWNTFSTLQTTHKGVDHQMRAIGQMAEHWYPLPSQRHQCYWNVKLEVFSMLTLDCSARMHPFLWISFSWLEFHRFIVSSHNRIYIFVLTFSQFMCWQILNINSTFNVWHIAQTYLTHDFKWNSVFYIKKIYNRFCELEIFLIIISYMKDQH